MKRQENMPNNRKILAITVPTLGAAFIILVFFWFHSPEKESLRDALGRAFNRPSNLIELNMPPAEGRYPGTVLIMPKPGQSLPLSRVGQPNEIPKASTTLTVDMSSDAEASLSSHLFGNADSKGDVSVHMTLDELRLYETDINQDLKKRLLSDESVIHAEKRGLMPRVIVRTYESVVSYKIACNDSLSADAWQKMQGILLNAGGRISSDGEITLKSDKPVVIAYESMLVNYISTSLSSGAPSDVELRDALSNDALFQPVDLSAFKMSEGNKDVRYVAIGNDKYSSNAFGNLRIVKPSVEVVESVFLKAGALPLLSEARLTDADDSSLNITLSLISEKLSQTRPLLFIFYFTGHAIAGRGGQLYLVTSDYSGDLIRDLGEDLLLGQPRIALEK